MSFREYLPEAAIDGWQFNRISPRVFEYTLSPTKSITLSGSDVDTDSFKPRLPHILQRIALKHTDSANADSTTIMTATLFRKNPASLFERIWRASSVVGDLIATFDLNETQYRSQDYRLRLNGTNTELVFPAFYLQAVV